MFKKAVLIMLAIFFLGVLICFYNSSRNGRYVFSNNREGIPIILDSRTGEVYAIKSRKKISLENYKPIK
ncbi:hypothetical protein [Flavobacterium sp. FlaQc-50]|uniref:hypothetical protein n=1 Tax=unclassified Flavobacterium TaxID=196869 RepID=UPI0037563789